MADQQISELIDVGGFNSDLQQVINGINSLEAKIAEANGKVLNVRVTLEGAESLQDLTEATKKYKQAISDLGVAQKQNIEVSNQINIINEKTGENVSSVLSQYAQLKIQIDANNKSISQLKNSIKSNNDTLQTLNKYGTKNTEITDKLTEANNKNKGSLEALIIKNKELSIEVSKLNNIITGGYEKQVIAAQKAEVKQVESATKRAAAEKAAYDKSVIAAERAEMKQVAAATRAAEKEVQAAERATIGYQMMQKAKNMALRFPALLAEIAIFTVLFEVVQKITETFTKASQAEEIAKDRLKEYNDELKELKKSINNLSVESFKNYDKEFANAEGFLKTLNDQRSSIDAKKDAYSKLNDLMPQVLKNYTEEEVLAGKANNKIKESIDLYSELKGKIDAQQTVFEQQSNIFQKDYQTQQNRKKIPNATEDYVLNSKVEAERDAMNATKNEIQDLKTQLENITAPIPTEKKPSEKKPSVKSDMMADLEDAKHAYDLTVNSNKKYFEEGRQTFEEQKLLYYDNIAAANMYYDRLLQIVEKYHHKGAIDDKKYLELKDKFKAENAKINTELEKNTIDVNKTIEDSHIEAGKEIDDLVLKLKTQRAELNAVAAEIKAIEEGKEISRQGAQGIGGFLSAFGFNDSYSQDIKERKAQIKKIKEEYALQSGLADSALMAGNETQYFEHTKKAAELDKQLKQQELELQKQHDQDILQAKEEISKKTVELAQETYKAIRTIMDNQFVREQQQLQIQMQSLELLSKEKIQAIEASSGYAITKQNEEAKVAAQTAAQQNANQQKQNQLALKKAEAEKKAAEANILLSTAQAIVGTIASFATKDLLPEAAPLMAAMIGLEASIGAAQYAAASSVPLPQFESGGTTATPFFIAAEGNKPELITTPKGDMMLATTEGVYSAPIGSKISNAKETEEMIRMAAMSIGYNAHTLNQLMDKKERAMTDKRIVEELRNLNDTTMRAAMMKQSNKIEVTVKENKLQRYS
jgi:hypothetical protein